MNYLPLDKVALALVHVTRKLPYYFKAHIVIVLTEHPFQALLRQANFLRRIAKWRTSLGAFDINYSPRTSIKGHVLTDFMAKFTHSDFDVMSVCKKTSSLQKKV